MVNKTTNSPEGSFLKQLVITLALKKFNAFIATIKM